MALSLQWYTDAGLTALASPFAITHLVDGSNDPQDFVFYLGSNNSSNKFEAQSNPGVDQIAVSIVNATPLWQASTAYVLDDEVRTTAKNGFKYKATVAGTTGASEPTWPTTVGNTVVDGTVTWQNIGPIHESTEVKLALTQGGLGSAVAGDPLDVGTQITGGTANAVPIYVRVDDDTEALASDTELSLETNTVIEMPV